MAEILSVRNIEVFYGKVVLVLKGLFMEVKEKEIVAVLGANGAGKSTTLKAISGLLKSEDGEVTDGSIEFYGNRIDKKEPEEIVRLGIVQVLEGRRVVEDLGVEENLLAGAHCQKNRKMRQDDLQMIYEYFPHLVPRRRVMAGYISGGEQQMLALGRALMSRPKMMLLDEPSMGLSPLMVKEIFRIIGKINREQQMPMVLVEQNALIALSLASRGYVMENGRIVLDDTAENLVKNEDVKEFYLGLSDLSAKKSYKEVKHYRRRKRWIS